MYAIYPITQYTHIDWSLRYSDRIRRVESGHCDPEFIPGNTGTDTI